MSTPARDYLAIIHPDEGKRYKLNIKGEVSKLTIGKVKECLSTASSCSIPRALMTLKLNGVVLHNNDELCGAYGIVSGATLVIEEKQQQQQRHSGVVSSFSSHPSVHASSLTNGSGPHDKSRARMSDGNEQLLPLTHFSPTTIAAVDGGNGTAPTSALSTRRRLLELQTLDEQERFLQNDRDARNRAVHGTLARVQDDIDSAAALKRRLTRQKAEVDRELAEVERREHEAEQEKERLAALHAEEAARAEQRQQDLEARRAQLRAEQEATRAVALLRLENERKKAELAAQKAAYEAEKERVTLEQKSLDTDAKARELAMREREIEAEHKRLALLREQRHLEKEKRTVLQRKLHYYNQLGIEPPESLLKEVQECLNPRTEGPITTTNATLPVPKSTPSQGSSSSGGVAMPRHSLKRNTSGTSPVSQPLPVTHMNDGNSNRNDNNNEGSDGGGGGGGLPLRAMSSASAPLVVMEDGAYYDAAENAAENLLRLGEELALPQPLVLDENCTCVINIDDRYTLLITYDADTERLFLYSTLLTSISGGGVDATADPQLRLELYELLLEGALLGRDMCGGGVGASLQQNFVLMSTSLYMPTSQPWALRTLVPQFVRCLDYWRGVIAKFLDERLGSSTSRNVSNKSSLAAAVGMRVSQSPSPPAHHRLGQHKPKLSRSQHADLYHQRPLASGVRRPGATATSLDDDGFANTSTTSSATYREAPLIGLEVAEGAFPTDSTGSNTSGVLVLGATGQAAVCGLQPRDVITAIDGAVVHSAEEFRMAVSRLRPGEMVELGVERDGKPYECLLRVGSTWVPA